MYNVREIKWLANRIAEIDALAEVFVRTALYQEPHASSARKFITYSPVEGEKLSFEASAHHVTMRFKFRHAHFEYDDRKELAGEFDWYLKEPDGKFKLVGSGIQVLFPGYILLPNGEISETGLNSPVHELVQLEADISLIVLDAIQSRLPALKKHVK